MKDYVRGNKERNGTLIYAIFFLLPFLQLGFSYYVSVSFLLFAIALISAIANPSTYSPFNIIIVLSAFFLFFFKAFTLIIQESSSGDVLLPLREFLCFVAIVFISQNIAKSYLKTNRIEKYLCAYLLVLFLFVGVQLIFFLRGTQFNIPINFFVMNAGTLEGVEQALYHETRLRPMGTYGEPSYLAWIVLSLTTIVLIREDLSRKARHIIILAAYLTILFSQSLSGFLSMNILLVAWWFKTGKIRWWIIVGSALSFFLIVTLFPDIDLVIRYYDIASGDDVSYNNRMTDPLLYIEKMLSRQQVFGVSNYTVLRDGINNAFIGMFLLYGLLSIPIVWLLIKVVGKNILVVVYLILSSNFNGSLFSFDKAIVISFVIGLSSCIFAKEVRLRSEN